MKDQELQMWVERMIAGDQRALDMIYQSTRKLVYGTVAMLVPFEI